MNESVSKFIKTMRDSAPKWLPTCILVLLVGIAFVSADSWLPHVQGWLHGAEQASAKKEEEKHGGPGDAIQISEQAKRNIGLKVGDVEVSENYSRKLSVPGMVIGLPGRTRFQIASPITGIVTDVSLVRGQSTYSNERLFRLRLSHEDLVRAQTDFLRTLGELDAEQKEIARLEKAGAGIAEKLILQRQYARDKLAAVLRAQEEALHLHGLTAEQVEEIRERRKLIREVVVKAPLLHSDYSLHFDREETPHDEPDRTKLRPVATDGDASDEHLMEHRFVVERLPVHVGQAVQTGDTLAVLADYHYLYVEGWAFEQDADGLVEAANENQSVSAVPEGSDEEKTISGLKIIYVDNEIDPKSRALKFYVALPNEVSRDVERGGRTFLTWKFRPGQRMQVRIPVETWQDVIVLPVDAIAQDGPEFYVFVENGKEFVKRPIVVKYRDQFDAVLEYDGSISPGERVALNGAHQLLMALKKQAGGGVDPHAGHHH